MSSSGTMTVCVLWATEVRAAAASLRALRECLEDKNATDEQRSKAHKAAMVACYTALNGAENAVNIVVCEAERIKFEPQVTVVAPRETPPPCPQEKEAGESC